MDFKYALKVAVGGAFLAALFKDSDIGNVMFPALGLLSTLQPDFASTFKSGWGRLLGSAIGGVIGGIILTAFGTGSLEDFLSLSPFLGALGFILAAITCETLQLGSAYTQAGFVAFLLTTGQAATQDPWLYTFVRVSNNWIGVAMAMAIIFIFRDSDPREELQKNLLLTLSNTERAFNLIVRTQDAREKAAIHSLLADIQQTVTASAVLLSKAIYGIVGRRLQRENWRSLIACQRQLSRYLREMQAVSDAPSIQVFQPELVSFSERVSRHCEQLIQSLEIETPSPPSLSPIALANDLSILFAFSSYPLPEIERFSVFSFNLKQFYRELNQLSALISGLSQPSASQNVNLIPDQAFSSRLLRFKPLSFEQLRYIVAMGVSMGFILGLMRNLFSADPLFAYLGALGVLIPMLPILTYGSVSLGRIFLLPPLIGSTIVIFLTSTLGTMPLTVGLGLFFSTLICYRLKVGFLSSAGASLIVVSYFIPSHLYIAALSNILLGMFLSSFILSLLKVGDPDLKLRQNFTTAFELLGDLYYLACQSYQQGTVNQPTTSQLDQAIAKLLQAQPILKKLSNQVIINSPLGEAHQKLWILLITVEQELFNDLNALNAIAQEAIQRGHSSIPSELLSEFELLSQSTAVHFETISTAITKQTVPLSVTDLVNYLEAFEMKFALFCQQENSNSYSLEKVILFLAFGLHLKEIARRQIHLERQWQSLSGITIPT